MVRLTDRPDMTLDVYHGRKTMQHATSPLFYLWENPAVFKLCDLICKRSLDFHTDYVTGDSLLHDHVILKKKKS